MWLRVVYDSYLITTTFCENNKLSVCLMSKWCGSARRCLETLALVIVIVQCMYVYYDAFAYRGKYMHFISYRIIFNGVDK